MEISNEDRSHFLDKEEWNEATQEFEQAFKLNTDRQMYRDSKIDASQVGIKHDSAKPRMELLDADFLEDVAQVLTRGAAKYAANNWRGGISYSRLIGACFRHLLAILRGDDVDPEWGLPHTAHLACEVMFLHFMIKNRKDLDDRWKA